MKQIGVLIVLVLVLSACGQAPTPTATPDIQATAAFYANTMVAETLTAQPTDTALPTATQAPTETATLAPTETATPDINASTATPDLSMTQVAGPTPTVFTGTFAPGNIQGLPTALLYIQNNTGVKEIIVTLTGTTKLRSQPVYYSYKVNGYAMINIIYVASYSVMVQIPGKGYVSTSFVQQSKDKTVMRVDWNKVVTHGP